MIQLVKCFDLKEAHTNENFEIFIDFMKWGFVSGNGCWAESHGAEGACTSLWKRCDDLGITYAMQQMMMHFGFNEYRRSGHIRAIASASRSKKRYEDIELIIPETFYDYAEKYIPHLYHSGFSEKCRKILHMIQEYFSENSVPLTDIQETALRNFVPNTYR
jgi:hypothetical protein